MQKLTIYYDGQCPLCLAEIEFLKTRNSRDLLAFVDLSEPSLDEDKHQISCAMALERIHGRLGDGRLLVGVPVFAEAYRRAGLHALSWLLSQRWFSPVLSGAYSVFARYRRPISRTIGPLLLRLVTKGKPATIVPADAATGCAP
ncbi:MAG: DUF393 domain-containing protein [Betaproteobacteria bacterium]|jgi:predicted DCC family thiol-disulfide oxidoreductase YuxK|nr:DUF393 domain-containing protein [Rhodocyclales bacterium]